MPSNDTVQCVVGTETGVLATLGPFASSTEAVTIIAGILKDGGVGRGLLRITETTSGIDGPEVVGFIRLDFESGKQTELDVNTSWDAAYAELVEGAETGPTLEPPAQTATSVTVRKHRDAARKGEEKSNSQGIEPIQPS